MKFYTKIAAFTNSLRSEEEGATAVEYGLLVALIAAVIIGTVTTLGTDLKAAFTSIAAVLPATY